MELNCQYQLLEDRESYDCYGVAVSLGDETARVEHITADREAAEHLMHMLERGRVTPVTLLDVVEDFMGQL